MTDLTGRMTARTSTTTSADHPVGRFSVDLLTDTWWWDDALFCMYGFAPHEVVPSTALMLAHQHPDDPVGLVARVSETLTTGEPFTAVHTAVDATGRARLFSITGEPAEQRVHGRVLDLTEIVDFRARRAATASIEASARSRAGIEQAVGAVALAEGVPADVAFRRLRAVSNDANVPLRTLATAIVEQLPALSSDPGRLPRFLRELSAPTHRRGPHSTASPSTTSATPNNSETPISTRCTVRNRVGRP